MNLQRISILVNLGLLLTASPCAVWAQVQEEMPSPPKTETEAEKPEEIPLYESVANGDPKTRMSVTRRALKKILPPTPEAQAELLDYCVEKIGRKVPPVPLPKGDVIDVLSWQRSRHEMAISVGVEKALKGFYAIAYRDLIIARGLLLEKDLERRRLGMMLASYCDLRLGGELADTRLRAGIYEAFLLPNMDAAKANGGRDVLSLQSLLQGAAGRYGAAKNEEKQIAVLQLLAKVAENRNTADSARYKLASLWANSQQYSKAIAVLKKITSKELQAPQWIAALESRQLEQQAQEKAANEAATKLEAEKEKTQ